MTPLAQHLLNDWCSPIRDRSVSDPESKLPLMISAKCFECTELREFVFDLANTSRTRSDVFDTGQIFAPAPVTFLDFFLSEHGQRCGLLIVEREDGKMVVSACNADAIYEVGILESSETSHISGDVFTVNRNVADDPRNVTVMQLAAYFLCLINTPKLVGKITRLPHAGLQKKVAREVGMAGKYPLHAWTEITLCIDPSGQAALEESSIIEAHLSGQKCLHFVRSFLRWRLNRLERVKAHWRGDASLGIRRSRYVVTP